MSISVSCPKCGDPVTTEQIDYRKRYYCNHCGGLPYNDGRPETGRGHINSGEPKGPAQAKEPAQ